MESRKISGSRSAWASSKKVPLEKKKRREKKEKKKKHLWYVIFESWIIGLFDWEYMRDCTVSPESTVDPCVQMEFQKLMLTSHLNNRKSKVLDSVLFVWLLLFVRLFLFFLLGICSQLKKKLIASFGFNSRGCYADRRARILIRSSKVCSSRWSDCTSSSAKATTVVPVPQCAWRWCWSAETESHCKIVKPKYGPTF